MLPLGNRSFQPIVLVQLVPLDGANQLAGVLLIGGVATILQTAGPSGIVRGLVGKKNLVAGIITEEVAVIHKGTLYIVVGPNAGLDQAAVLVVINFDVIGGARPIVFAFDPKVVVGRTGERSLSPGGFVNGLGQGDAGGNATAVHLADGDVLELADVAGGIDGSGMSGGDQKPQQTKRQKDETLLSHGARFCGCKNVHQYPHQRRSLKQGQGVSNWSMTVGDRCHFTYFLPSHRN